MTNSRAKGAAAEREVVRILKPILGDMHRNWQMQAAVGGADLYGPGIEGWAVEIKRQKAYSRSWWTQAAVQADRSGMKPVLIYRLDRGRWRALMSLHDLRPDLKDFSQVEMNLEAWANLVARERDAAVES